MRGLGVVDNFEAIFGHERSRGRNQKTEFVSEGVFETILKRALDVVRVIDHTEGEAGRSSEARRPQISGRKLVERIEEILIASAETDPAIVESVEVRLGLVGEVNVG